MPATELRQASWEDLPAVCQLIQQAFAPLLTQLPSPPTALDETVASLTGHLSSGSQIFVAVRQSRIVACLLVLPPENGCAEIKRVCTHPDLQGQGLGSTLLDYAEQELQRQDVQQLKLSTRRRLPSNLQFYQRLGYEVSAQQPYPQGIDDERVTLSKPLAELVC